jgi:hypothetical protein
MSAAVQFRVVVAGRTVLRRQPRDTLSRRAPVTLGRAFLTVAVSTAVCTAVGVGLGIFVGYVAPDFYAMWFRGGLPAGLDPVQIGIGNGVNGGVFCGVVVGLVIVGIVAYGDLRRMEVERFRPPAPEREAPVGRHTESAQRPRHRGER